MERKTMMMENRKEVMITTKEDLFYEDRAQEETVLQQKVWRLKPLNT
jgi:hypothetical protein